MDDEQRFFHSYLHPVPPSLPPPNHLLLEVQKTPSCPQNCLRPPERQPASARLPQSFPSLSSFKAQDSSKPLMKGPGCVYLPLAWRTEVPCPTNKKAPPGGHPGTPHPAPSRRTHALPPRTADPLSARDKQSPPELMRKTYQGLRAQARNLLLRDWVADAPTPFDY